jgi:hypothetical protein
MRAIRNIVLVQGGLSGDVYTMSAGRAGGVSGFRR